MQRYDVEKDGVTQSVLSGWLKCREFTRLGLAEGWTTAQPKKVFQFGDLFHGVMEHIYGNKVQKKIEDSLIKKTINQELSRWKKENPMCGEELLQDLELNATLLEAVLPHYFRYWYKQDFVKTKWIALEKEFEMPIKLDIGKTIIFRGKWDGIYKEGKGKYLFESKTKSVIDERVLYDLLTFDFQTDVYSLAMKNEYGEYPMGVRYNVVRKPGNRLNKKESLVQFFKRVYRDVENDPENYFKRFRIYRPPSSLRKFESELKEILTDFYLWNVGKVRHYRNTNSCTNRYGTCSMLPICSTGNFKGHIRKDKVFTELSYTKED